MSKSRTITIPEGAMNVRAFIFRDDHDPYVLWHDNPEQLSDEIIQSYLAEWLTKSPEFLEEDSAENFEEFFYWLEREKGFVDLIVADSAYKFDLSIL